MRYWVTLAAARGRAHALAVLTALACASLAGCEALAISALGAGASAGISYTVNGAAYRTFTAPEARVKKAALAALKRMASEVHGTEKIETGLRINASMPERKIEIDIEPLSENVTRVRAVAHKGVFRHDTATATEIITQTEKLMGVSPR